MEAARRKNRKTEATIVAQHDDFLGWITLCESHNYWAEMPSKSKAISWMTEPDVFCPECAAIVDRTKQIQQTVQLHIGAAN
jgi:hypothetical protein